MVTQLRESQPFVAPGTCLCRTPIKPGVHQIPAQNPLFQVRPVNSIDPQSRFSQGAPQYAERPR